MKINPKLKTPNSIYNNPHPQTSNLWNEPTHILNPTTLKSNSSNQAQTLNPQLSDHPLDTSQDTNEYVIYNSCSKNAFKCQNEARHPSNIMWHVLLTSILSLQLDCLRQFIGRTWIHQANLPQDHLFITECLMSFWCKSDQTESPTCTPSSPDLRTAAQSC